MLEIMKEFVVFFCSIYLHNREIMREMEKGISRGRNKRLGGANNIFLQIIATIFGSLVLLGEYI